MPRRVLDYDREYLEDEKFLEEFFTEMGEDDSWDPRQRYVVRFRYKGSDPSKLTAEYMIEAILVDLLHMTTTDLLAVIAPPGFRETDVCLVSERAYQKL